MKMISIFHIICEVVSRLWRTPGLVCPSCRGLYWLLWYRQNYRKPGINTQIFHSRHICFQQVFIVCEVFFKIVTHAGPNLSRLRASCWRPWYQQSSQKPGISSQIFQTWHIQQVFMVCSRLWRMPVLICPGCGDRADDQRRYQATEPF